MLSSALCLTYRIYYCMWVLYAFLIIMLQGRHTDPRGEEFGAHGSYDGSCLTEELSCSLEAQYIACGDVSSSSSPQPIRYMVNHNAWEIVANSGHHHDPNALFFDLHKFSGNALARLGEGHPLFQYPNFFSGTFGRTVDVLVGAGDAYSAVHQVSKCLEHCPLVFPCSDNCIIVLFIALLPRTNLFKRRQSSFS